MKRYIIILIILSLAVLLYFLFIHKPAVRPSNSSGNSQTEVKYRNDGQVVFISPEGDTSSTLYVEVVRDYHEHARGLMYRHNMPDSVGMLFIYQNSDYRSFWMKNTHISLDLIFISRQFKILQIHEYAIPYSEESIVSTHKAKYVVEANAGYSDEHMLQVGGKVDLNIK